MAMPAIAHRWTAAEVRALIDESRPSPRYELIDGELLVTPSPHVPHQDAVAILLQIFAGYLRDHPFGRVFVSPADIELEPETVLQPDVFVVPLVLGRRPRKWPDVRALMLAIEIVSPGSARHDRVTKRRFFQRMGVPEYWVVDLEARMVERWRPGDERAEVADERIAWHPTGAAIPCAVDLVAFFAEVLDDQ